ncbi:MAG: Y-family DNA polymerase [Proteobacteria bacterium]|nr:Y-family DNA polymerase [Pseudomonadota bacterium]
MNPIFALIDCNSFFVSCEKVFQPHLEGQPVIVLSSNDGCAIARSNEAKALGIQMGAPLFKIQNILRKNRVKVFSSNFSLYGDMSARVMETLKTFSPSLEVYSIDEAFLDLSSLREEELFSYGSQIRKIVKLWTGIPVSIGMGSTKTLAKVANHIAKKHPFGCYVLTKLEDIEEVLRTFPLQEVWGIGRQWSKKLSYVGLRTAWDLAQADIDWIRKTFNLSLARTALELKGLPCSNIEGLVSSKKSIISSRSFGKSVKSFEDLQEAISFHASKVAQKLRQQKSVTALLNVFIRTNPFHAEGAYYTNSCIVPLIFPSQDTAVLIKAARAGLEKIFNKGLDYKKVGVMALSLASEDQIPVSIFQNSKDLLKRQTLLKTLDKLNGQFGRDSLFFASEGVHKTWCSKVSLKSPSFTQDWTQLPRVR